MRKLILVFTIFLCLFAVSLYWCGLGQGIAEAKPFHFSTRVQQALAKTFNLTSTGTFNISNINDVTLDGSILASSGTLTLGGTGGTNNENITFDFESSANRAIVDTDTGAIFRFNLSTQFAGATTFIDTATLYIGTANDSRFKWTTTDNDNLQLGLKVGNANFSGYFSIMEDGDIGTSTRSPVASWPNGATPADPTLAGLSSDASEPLDIWALWHDQSDPWFGWGNGDLKFKDNGTETMRISHTVTASEVGLYVLDADGNTLKRVTVGADDSGAAGFKVLRIAN